MISVSVPSLALSADVAMRRRTEDKLRRTQAELDQRVRERTAALADANIHLMEAQRLANLGSWSWDVRGKHDYMVGSTCTTSTDFGPGQLKGTLKNSSASSIPMTVRRCSASIGAALNSGKHFSHEERIMRPDGSIRHLHSVGEVVRDESGTAVRMLGVCLDVTERKQAERALQRIRAKLSLAAQGRARLRDLHARRRKVVC